MRKLLVWPLVALITLGLAGCASDKKQTTAEIEDASVGAGGVSASGLGSGSNASGQVIGSQAGTVDDPLSRRVIYFEYDSSVLTDEGRFIVEAHAAYLANNPGMAVVLEGHADERGTREYNLALGESRGAVIGELFQGLGIDPSAIRVVSYGEERSVALGHDENAWAMNRRVEILY